MDGTHDTMKNPRLMIAGTGSGCGKTWITCAMLRAFSMRGCRVAAFKCGPDYIDPMFHERILSIPSGNLDLFFTGEEETRALFFQDNDSDLSIIEGVMGLYDGLGGICEEASGYHLAKTLHAPVVLVVGAYGKGRSLAAEIAGFLAMDHEKLIKGVILNQISEAFYFSIKPIIEELTGVPVFGFMPRQSEWGLESRHLGLKLPGEHAELLEHVTAAARKMEETVNLDAIMEMAGECAGKEEAFRDRKEGEPFPWLHPGTDEADIRIGVARDEAFCFYYRDNLRMLRHAGAKLIFFSPLWDEALPEGLDGLLLGGGYPELWAKELSENRGMREQIRLAIERGMPSLAECGGFLYLHETLEPKEGGSYPMAGVLKGKGFDTGKLVRFGYAEFSFGGVLPDIRGHEFHYFDSENCGTDGMAKKPVTGKSWKCMHVGSEHVWGFGHLYYPSSPGFPAWFVQKCREYHCKTFL